MLAGLGERGCGFGFSGKIWQWSCSASSAKGTASWDAPPAGRGHLWVRVEVVQEVEVEIIGEDDGGGGGGGER